MKDVSLLASCKLVAGDGSSEGSRTAKVGTDEQELHMRPTIVGKVTQPTNAYNQQRQLVDVAGIDRKNMLLLRLRVAASAEQGRGRSP